MKNLFRAILASCTLVTSALAQMDHGRHAAPAVHHDAIPTATGHHAFATISEIVRILKADSTTDWSTVNLEALRQHLIDMDDVMTRAAVVQRSVDGGVRLDVTGTGRTAAAIRRMVTSHARVLGEHTPYQASVRDIADGVSLTVVARDTSSASTVAMLRGLGFAGLIVEGDHHAEHHLMMARGISHR